MRSVIAWGGLSVVVTGSLAASAAAQSPAHWVDLSVPQGTVPGGLLVGDKVIAYRDGTFLRVFSAVTATWQAIPLSFGTSVRLRGDIVLVPEGDRWTGFSAWRGVADVLPANFAASTLYQAEDVACVTEGAQVHAFSAFTGHWHSHALPAGWTLGLGSRLAVIRPANGPFAASAFDVYTGQWHDLPQQPFGLSGERWTGAAAMFESGSVFAFAPLQGGWRQSQLPTGFPSWYQVAGPFGESVCADGQLFSPATGTFARLPVPTNHSGRIECSGLVASGNDQFSRYFLAGVADNTWVTMPAGVYLAGANDNVGLAHDLSQLFAFSPLRGLSAPWPAAYTGRNVAWRGSIVAASDAVNPVPGIYSSLTGQWHTPPAAALPTMPFVADTSALQPLTGGLVAAFSARTGAFVPAPGPTTMRNGYLATAADAVHAFDARNDRWRSVPWQGALGQGPFTTPVPGHVSVLFDPTQLIGFSVRAGELAATLLPEPIAEILVGADVACVRTATHVLAFRGLADNALWNGFPDENYLTGIGNTLRAQSLAPAGGYVFLGVAPRLPAPVSVPPYGELWIDASAALIFGAATPPGEQRIVHALSVPNVPVLRGSEWLLQTLTFPAVGTPWLGETATFLIP